MQTQATSRGTCPGIMLGQIALGDHGTLLMYIGGLWHYVNTAGEWSPGLTPQVFIKTFHKAPPANVNQNEWGIVQGLTDDQACCDRNWSRAEVQQSVDLFVTEILGTTFIQPDGTCLDPIKKGRMLARRTARWDKKITPAPMPQLSATADK